MLGGVGVFYLLARSLQTSTCSCLMQAGTRAGLRWIVWRYSSTVCSYRGSLRHVCQTPTMNLGFACVPCHRGSSVCGALVLPVLFD